MTWRADLIEAAAKASYEIGHGGNPHEPWDSLTPWWRRVLTAQMERALPTIADAISERGWSSTVAAELRGDKPMPPNDPSDYDGDLFGGDAA